MGKFDENFSKQIRDKIEKNLEIQEERRRREIFRKRVEIARKGIQAYHNKQMAEAASQFRSYIKILEEWKGAPEGGLTPGHFDLKQEMSELLLLSAIYWDLAKLFDRTKTKDKVKEMRGYLSKYVLFSKGMPYQGVSSETMRKYIWNHKSLHEKDFKEAYEQIAGVKAGGCFVATSLAEYFETEELNGMRSTRDRMLERGAGGRLFVRTYYVVGYRVAWVLNRSPKLVRSLAASAVRAAHNRIK